MAPKCARGILQEVTRTLGSGSVKKNRVDKYPYQHYCGERFKANPSSVLPPVWDFTPAPPFSVEVKGDRSNRRRYPDDRYGKQIGAPFNLSSNYQGQD